LPRLWLTALLRRRLDLPGLGLLRRLALPLLRLSTLRRLPALLRRLAALPWSRLAL